jgi:hypothetical protein
VWLVLLSPCAFAPRGKLLGIAHNSYARPETKDGFAGELRKLKAGHTMVEPLTRHCLRIPTKGMTGVMALEKVRLKHRGNAKIIGKKRDGSRVVGWTPALPGPSERKDTTVKLQARRF